MGVRRSISLVSSSTASTQTLSVTSPGFRTEVYSMDGSESQSSVFKVEDDVVVGKVEVGKEFKTVQPNAMFTLVPNKDANSILVREVSSKHTEGEISATATVDISVERTNTVNANGEMGSNNRNASSVDVIDAIAEIAANSDLEGRRRKRPRPDSTKSSASQLSAMISNPPTIVTASMSNHYAPPRLINGTWVVKNNTSNRRNKTDKNNSDNQSTNTASKSSVHMLNSVGLECSEDGGVLLERFDDDETSNSSGNDTDAIVIKAEDEAPGDENTDPSPRTRNLHRGIPPSWTLHQHRAFAAAIFEIGLKNCSPSVIMENMRKQPRYITRERTKSHLQKYRQTKERSKAEFLKEYDSFFKSTEQAKSTLSRKNFVPSSCNAKEVSSRSKTNNFNQKEPIPKAILTAALEGKKPSKLLGGQAAALLSYSVLNSFSTKHGPDQLQYKAAKLTEFPSMSEEEKKSSVGASLLQVKTLIDNMTDVLLKSRHGIDPMPTRKMSTGDDDVDSSSCDSSDDGYSDDDEDNSETVATGDKRIIEKTASKEQELLAPTSAPQHHGGLFAMGAGGPPGHPLYQGPPGAYPPGTFPAPGAPPPVPSAFPPPQYAHAPPTFYGGAPHAHMSVAAAPGYGAAAGFLPPPMHYPQDPRIHPYQQPPPAQVASYPGAPAPSMQPSYYTGVPGYAPYYGNTGDGTINPGASGANPSTEYSQPPHHGSSSDLYSTHSHQASEGQQQQRRHHVYDQQPSPSYPKSNAGRRDDRTYDLTDSSPTDKNSRRRAEKRSKRRRGRDSQKKSDDDFKEFLDRLSTVPSPPKASQRSASSPIQRSRGQGQYKPAASPLSSEDSPLTKPTRKRSRQEGGSQDGQHRQYQQELDSNAQSYAKAFESPFSESEASRFTSPYQPSPSNQNQSHTQLHPSKQSSSSGQFWESSNFLEHNFSDQQQSQDANSGDFHQQANQFADKEQETQHQDHRRYGTSYSSPAGESTGNYFFGD